MTNDPLANALNIAPMVPSDSSSKSNEIIAKQPNEIESLASLDFTQVRENYYNIILKGSEALEDALEVARQSQSPRSYEVLATLMGTLKDVNKELLAMHKTAKELQREDVGDNITNNTLVLTTSELLTLMKKNQE
jgi:hypothetical protein